MNRKRWIYIGVLGIVVVAFIMDRLFLGTPQAAEAKLAPPDPKPGQPAPAVPKNQQEPPPVVDPSLAWLERLGESRSTRDVFAPSPEWLIKQQEKIEAAAAAEQEKGPKPGSPEAFQAAHKLQATTVMGNGGLAVVDDQCLKVGDTLDGFRLVHVRAGAVEFRRGADHVTLSLPMPPGGDPNSPERSASPLDETGPATPAGTRPAAAWGLLRRLWSR